MVRPLIVMLGIAAANRGGLGHSFTGSRRVILVGRMGSTRLLRLSNGVRSSISMRGVTR